MQSVQADSEQKQTIATLRPSQPLKGVFACARKERLIARTGTPYLSLELRDRTGTVQAAAFRDADALAGRFEQGDLIEVEGRTEQFRDELRVVVDRIRKADPGTAQLENYLPKAYRDLDELDGFLEHLASQVHDAQYSGLLSRILGDEALRERFRTAPCTRSGHHAYLGGLLEHTVAVATLVQELCQLHPRLNSDLLTTAAIVHDIGKIEEFEYGATFELSDAGRLLGHLQLGQRIVEQYATGTVSGSRLLQLLNCILSHHGTDAVPGRKFASAEALALYRINALEAGVKGVLEHGT